MTLFFFQMIDQFKNYISQFFQLGDMFVNAKTIPQLSYTLANFPHVCLESRPDFFFKTETFF
jgi:hypothetical protein